MQHERETLNELTEMRAKAVSGQLSLMKNCVTKSVLESSWGIMVAVENYPDLKASKLHSLQSSLNEVKSKFLRRDGHKCSSDLIIMLLKCFQPTFWLR